MPFIREKSCGIVVFREVENQRLYLLLHYPGGHWDFAKGHVEKNEDEMTTAKRELEEETGITDIQLTEGFRERMHYYFRYKNTLSSKDVIYFAGKTQQENIKISDEHQNHDWLPYDQAKEKLTFDNAKNMIEKVEKFLVATQK